MLESKLAGTIEKSALGVDSSFLDSCPEGWNSYTSPKSHREKQLFSLLDFRSETQSLVITLSTSSMPHNYKISFSAAPRGAEFSSADLDISWYNHDV